jgi:hypothetical protein
MIFKIHVFHPLIKIHAPFRLDNAFFVHKIDLKPQIVVLKSTQTNIPS